MTRTTRSIFVALCAATLFGVPAWAKGNPKMAQCNKDAAGKTGDERKKFMSECLSAKPAEKQLTPQQQKMKDCNAQAKGKKGQERKDFMKTCLSAK